MPATKRFMNWSSVTFTPQTGQPLPITGVSTVEIETHGNLQKFSGDGDKFFTTVVSDVMDPTVTIHTADLGVIRALPLGTVGTLSATLNDARNGSGSGAITYTLTNAVVASGAVRGSHRQFGQGTLIFSSFSSDGITNPLSTTIAP